MLHLILVRLLPAWAHRLGLRLAHRIRTGWWRIRRPKIIGCRVVAVNPAGEVLLIRHSYGSPVWMLPGGGVARGEAPTAAAMRELAEETGCKLEGSLQVAATRDVWHGAINEVHVIVGRAAETPIADHREITAAQFFPLGNLPRDIGKGLTENLPGWLAAYAAPALPLE
jgi:ADP-ribose pyrophosphatase YjhB (NUDIX family)